MEQSLEEIKFALAYLLKNRRKELGLTQTEVGDRVGILQPHIARMETIGPGSVDSLIQWCIALEMKLILEPMKTPDLVTKALDDPEAIEELIDAPAEDIVEIAPIEEVLEAGKDPGKGVIITEKNKNMDFCKHGFVKGFCKKGCK